MTRLRLHCVEPFVCRCSLSVYLPYGGGLRSRRSRAVYLSGRLWRCAVGVKCPLMWAGPFSMFREITIEAENLVSCRVSIALEPSV